MSWSIDRANKNRLCVPGAAVALLARATRREATDVGRALPALLMIRPVTFALATLGLHSVATPR